MVRKAGKCKVDAVKFQTFNAENYISSSQPERKERIRKFELNKDQFIFKKIANELGLIFN